MLCIITVRETFGSVGKCEKNILWLIRIIATTITHCRKFDIQLDPKLSGISLKQFRRLAK